MIFGECTTCGTERCGGAHECEGCGGEATGQCDREHETCADCTYQVGDGPDVIDRCARCDEEDDERYDEAAEAVHGD